MRYELRKDALYLRCGPFVSKIPYSEIKKVSKTNLAFHPIASCRWPGFALGDCYYGDWGNVRMYSTRMCNDIILIKTTTRLYGITPNNEEFFIANLKRKIEDAISN
ncbi:MAG: PH domain-containing protein [bacterium]